jgi:hypothetical protein
MVVKARSTGGRKTAIVVVVVDTVVVGLTAARGIAPSFAPSTASRATLFRSIGRFNDRLWSTRSTIRILRIFFFFLLLLLFQSSCLELFSQYSLFIHRLLVSRWSHVGGGSRSCGDAVLTFLHHGDVSFQFVDDGSFCSLPPFFRPLLRAHRILPCATSSRKIA